MKKVKKKKKQREVKPNIMELYETKYKKLVFLGITITSAVLLLGVIFIYHFVIFPDTTKIDQKVNYEDELIEAANQVDPICSAHDVNKIEYNPYLMENGVYSIYNDYDEMLYQYQGGYFWAEDKDLETLNEETVFKDLSKREAKILQSARDHVCKYIDDSKILKDKEWLKQKIREVPFYKYTDTTHPELLSVFEAPAVHMEIGIYYNDKFSEYFCEYIVIHELMHHVRYLTCGESIYNEYYFGTCMDEVITDIITFSMEPSLYVQRDMFPVYMFMHEPMYRYISVFEEDALEAYFYGYDEFFEKYGGDTFKIEHDLFAVLLESYDINYNSKMFCEGIFQNWEARY